METPLFRFTKPAPQVTSSVHDDGVVLLDPNTGKLFTSNSTGAQVWKGLQRRLSPVDIAANLAVIYRLSDDVALEHVTRFLAELVDLQLVVEGVEP